MILSFIEGSIIVKKQAVIQTGENPFRQVQYNENSEGKEMLLLTNENHNKISDVTESNSDNNNETDINNDDSNENKGVILDFRDTDGELVSNVNVDLEKSDTNTEKSMTMNSAEMDAFRRKYDELMKQLEKERFERELIARSR